MERIEWIRNAHQRFLKQKEKLRRRKRPKRQTRHNNQSLDNFEAPLADRMMESIARNDVERVKDFLDKLWRRNMNGGILIGKDYAGKDYAAIDAARKFLREKDFLNSKG